MATFEVPALLEPRYCWTLEIGMTITKPFAFRDLEAQYIASLMSARQFVLSLRKCISSSFQHLHACSCTWQRPTVVHTALLF